MSCRGSWTTRREPSGRKGRELSRRVKTELNMKDHGERGGRQKEYGEAFLSELRWGERNTMNRLQKYPDHFNIWKKYLPPILRHIWIVKCQIIAKFHSTLFLCSVLQTHFYRWGHFRKKKKGLRNDPALVSATHTYSLTKCPLSFSCWLQWPLRWHCRRVPWSLNACLTTHTFLSVHLMHAFCSQHVRVHAHTYMCVCNRCVRVQMQWPSIAVKGPLQWWRRLFRGKPQRCYHKCLCLHVCVCERKSDVITCVFEAAYTPRSKPSSSIFSSSCADF